LQGTPYRWLDISEIVSRICKEQNPNSDIVAIKYFTAEIKTKLSERGQVSWHSQQDYLLALKAHIPNISIIKGKYVIGKSQYHPYGDPVDFGTKHTVWRPEEKQTDVSIAVHMVCDATDSVCDQMVIFSNDSDLAPALAAIQSRTPNITIGTVAPLRNTQRKPSEDLRSYSDWTRYCIKEEELANAQLPKKVVTRKRPIVKPGHW